MTCWGLTLRASLLISNRSCPQARTQPRRPQPAPRASLQTQGLNLGRETCLPARRRGLAGLGPSVGSACPQPQPPGPDSGPPPLLAGSLLLAVCSRSGAERPPQSPLLSSSPFKPCTKAAPRPPTAHSPQVALPAGPCLSLSCSRCGEPPLPVPQTAACQPAPQAWLWSGLRGPLQGGAGALQGGKDSFATFPES